MRVLFVVPSYNEQQALPAVHRALPVPRVLNATSVGARSDRRVVTASAPRRLDGSAA